MKKHLLIFCLAVLSLAGFNLRNRTAVATSAEFPTSEQVSLGMRDDSHGIGLAREANSIFAAPSPQTAVSGDDNQQNIRVRSAQAFTFTPRTNVKSLSEQITGRSCLTIAGNGTFGRAADYYVYTLRRIVI